MSTTKQVWKKDFTPEEKQAYKNQKESEKQELNALYEKFITKKTIKEIIGMVANYKQMHRYTLRNRFMVLAQAEKRGDKKFVGVLNSYVNWKKQNIAVLKGSKAYKVQVPIFKKVKKLEEHSQEDEEKTILSHFKLGNVFDISSTDHYDQYLEERKQIDDKIMTFPEMDYDKAMEFVKTYFPDVQVRESFDMDRPDDAKGVFIPPNRVELYTKSSHTIFHEVGHWTARRLLDEKSYPKGEIIAELFCYLFLSKFVENLDYNFNYSNVWSSRITDTFELSEFETIYNKLDKFINQYFEEGV